MTMLFMIYLKELIQVITVQAEIQKFFMAAAEISLERIENKQTK